MIELCEFQCFPHRKGDGKNVDNSFFSCNFYHLKWKEKEQNSLVQTNIGRAKIPKKYIFTRMRFQTKRLNEIILTRHLERSWWNPARNGWVFHVLFALFGRAERFSKFATSHIIFFSLSSFLLPTASSSFSFLFIGCSLLFRSSRSFTWHLCTIAFLQIRNKTTRKWRKYAKNVTHLTIFLFCSFFSSRVSRI